MCTDHTVTNAKLHPFEMLCGFFSSLTPQLQPIRRKGKFILNARPTELQERQVVMKYSTPPRNPWHGSERKASSQKLLVGTKTMNMERFKYAVANKATHAHR